MQRTTRWLQRAMRGEIAAPLRLAVLFATILLAIVTAYLNARFPVARLSTLAFLYVIALDALCGLRWGVVAAIALALVFSIGEYYLGPFDQRPMALGNIVARSLIFLVVIGLVEVIRRQTAALQDNRLHTSERELERVRSELAEADALFHAVGDSIPFGAWQCDTSGHVIHVSDSFLQMLGMTLEDVRAGGWFNRTLPEDAERIRAAWANRENWPEVWEDEYRIIGADNRTYTILCRGRCVRDATGKTLGWTGFNLDLTELSKTREQLRFLVEAGRLLSMSLDPATTLERVANLAVPRIADWCAVETLQDGDLQTVAVRHSDPSKMALVRELRGYPRDHSESRGVYKVLRTGQSELYEHIGDDLLRQAARDEQHLSLLRNIGITSAMIVPLRARDTVLGVMTLVQAESKRAFTQEDLQFAEILAARAALAYDNACKHAKEQRVADTFQRASLPMSLPLIPGIRLHAAYLPGAEESAVGGDWYDAFQLPDGRLALSIGDVAGKGLPAAVAMASIRPALRGCALEGSSPAEVLARVNRRITFEGHGMVTALFGILNPVNLEFTVAAAGHPQPLLAKGDGSVEKIVAKGVPLGLLSNHAYEEATVLLEPGSLLVLYTDGLIEFDRNIVEGEKLLAQAVADQMKLQTPDPSSAIVRQVILGAPQDDIAVLTVSVASPTLEQVV